MRLVIADDSVVVRSGLVTLLSAAGLEVVAEAADRDALFAAVERVEPDAAVIDIRMPPTFSDEGLSAAARLRAEHPEVAVLVLSHYLAASFASRLLEQSPSGVGYLLKDRVADASALADALHRVVDGGCVVDPAIVERLMARAERRQVLAPLTERECDVLALMAEGLSNHAVAQRLGLSPKTLETHIGHVFDKLGLPEDARAHRRVRAVLAFLQAGPP